MWMHFSRASRQNERRKKVAAMGNVWHCFNSSFTVPVHVTTLALEHRLISVPVPDTVTFLSLFGVFVVPQISVAWQPERAAAHSKVRARLRIIQPSVKV